jgi:hypothetical protein
MSTGFEATVHLHDERVIDHSHDIVLVTYHIHPILFANKLFINNLKGTKAAICDSPG